MDDKKQKLSNWNSLKQITQDSNKKVYFKERDIFWLKVSENIGYEQNGKGDFCPSKNEEAIPKENCKIIIPKNEQNSKFTNSKVKDDE